MNTLQVELGTRSYPIYIGQNLLRQSDLITQHIKSNQVLIVSNETVAPLYLHKVVKNLDDFETKSVILPDGEQYK
ncbi:MAG: 3-dehydroquinate synthase, partial [Proteobacteria bacterium]|nr:3-dehydroquinate synthase [Pseudomonadota bacterium]